MTLLLLSIPGTTFRRSACSVFHHRFRNNQVLAQLRHMFRHPPMYKTTGIRLWYLCYVIPAHKSSGWVFESLLMKNGTCVKLCGEDGDPD